MKITPLVSAFFIFLTMLLMGLSTRHWNEEEEYGTDCNEYEGTRLYLLIFGVLTGVISLVLNVTVGFELL